MLVQSRGVKKKTIKLMLNGSSSGTWRFTDEGFKMTSIYSPRWSVKIHYSGLRWSFNEVNFCTHTLDCETINIIIDIMS